MGLRDRIRGRLERLTGRAPVSSPHLQPTGFEGVDEATWVGLGEALVQALRDLGPRVDHAWRAQVGALATAEGGTAAGTLSGGAGPLLVVLSAAADRAGGLWQEGVEEVRRTKDFQAAIAPVERFLHTLASDLAAAWSEVLQASAPALDDLGVAVSRRNELGGTRVVELHERLNEHAEAFADQVRRMSANPGVYGRFHDSLRTFTSATLDDLQVLFDAFGEAVAGEPG